MEPDRIGVACEGAVDAACADRLVDQARSLLGLLRAGEELAPGPVELSLVLCDDAFIRPLNARWRGRDAATDVLSFPLDEGDNLGDVVLSQETAARRVKPGQWGLEEELLFLLIHGLLHLLGHDHEDPDERAAMESAEQELWTGLGRPGTLRDP